MSQRTDKKILREGQSALLGEITPLRLDVAKQVYGAKVALSTFERNDFAKLNDDKDEQTVIPFVEEREAWNNKAHFLLSVIAYAVGLGNVWRFPYLCQKNGGGAFLIPYFIMLAIEGVPLCVLELGIGQRLRLGSIGVWNKIHPYLGGLGICSAIVAFLVGLYYNAIISWCFFYFFNSFTSPLAWSACPVSTNSTIPKECEISSPTAYFWFRETLDISPGIEELGGIQWKLAGCLALSWLLVFAFMSRGIQSSGKVMYFTAGFPYLVLIVFFGRAITLKGASDGLLHLFTPDMEKLKDPVVWLDAATQIFYSLGLGFGSLIAFGSYNPSDNNVTQDAIIVSMVNAFTAIFASLVIFAVLGFKATLGLEKCACRFIEQYSSVLGLKGHEVTQMTQTPEQCLEYYSQISTDPENGFAYLIGNSTCSLTHLMNEAAEGTGLAFIVFTQAIDQLPGAPFWSVIFFLMLLALGMGSIFGNFAGILTSIHDLKLLPWMGKRTLSAIMCSTSFLIGLLFMTKAGVYWIELFDSFSGTFSLMLVALCEMIGVCWIFKYSRFASDLKEMTGRSLSRYWEVTLKFLAPLLIVLVWGSSVAMRIIDGIAYHPYDVETGSMYSAAYPVWAQVISAVLVAVGIGPILAVALVRKMGWIKCEIDPSMANSAFNTSSSTAMFLRINTAASQIDGDSVSGMENAQPAGGHVEFLFVADDKNE